MRTSTIAKQRTGGRDSAFARALGREIRQRREALGLTQTIAAGPLTRAFVSSVESGRLIPSLPSLLIIARQLNASAATILRAVELQLEARDSGDQDETNIPC
jgi:transcriptional regulator with XRE-family HTH domain